ncbi:MAG: hypothetical protein V1748_04840 [Actinomycetota bacterium]
MGRRVGIIGVGQTHHASQRLDASGVELISEAVSRALDDAWSNVMILGEDLP